MKWNAALCGLVGFCCAMPAMALELEQETALLERGWVEVEYATPDAETKLTRLQALESRSQALMRAHPDRAEPLVWDALIKSTRAEAMGGAGSLAVAEAARDELEASARIDPGAMHGAAYLTLGALYYKVPGWPIGFGDDDRAREYLRKALALNPDGLHSNYFYGDFLYEQGNYAEAASVLKHAEEAPPRPGHEMADAGRRKDLAALLRKAKKRAR